LIVLEALHAERRTAHLLVTGPWEDVGAGVERLLDCASQLGILELRLRSADGFTVTRRLSHAGPCGLAPLDQPDEDLESPPVLPAALEHRYTIEAGTVRYTAGFEHSPAGLRLLSPYIGLLLATYGPFPRRLMHLRLAIYELCANIIEHGVPQASDPRLRLEIRFESDRIHCTVQDQCERFDPIAAPMMVFTDLLASRSPRGYGIPLVHRLLDSLQHTYDGTGNQLEFHKRIVRRIEL
jgi:anti-sigma regulatory factor (Ser/Thr protein kinase)